VILSPGSDALVFAARLSHNLHAENVFQAVLPNRQFNEDA